MKSHLPPLPAQPEAFSQALRVGPAKALFHEKKVFKAKACRQKRQIQKDSLGRGAIPHRQYSLRQECRSPRFARRMAHGRAADL